MIAVDTREVAQHPEIPEVLNELDVEVQPMDAGDYSFLDRDNNPLGIERCEIGNLLQKLWSGELESQLVKCSEAYSSVILLTEGVYDSFTGEVKSQLVKDSLALHKKSGKGYFRVKVFPKAKYTFIGGALSDISEMGIELIHSPNFSCTMDLIKVLYNQRRRPEEQKTLFRRLRTPKMPVKMSKNPAVPKLLALVNRMPEKVAIQLIYKYGSIWNILHADDKELLEIDGLGKILLLKLKEGVGKE